jgi:cholesterol 7-dehydrogenase
MDVEVGRTHRVHLLGRDLSVGRGSGGVLWCADVDGAMWEVSEVNQVVFVWYDEQRRSSAWQVPAVDPDMRQWRFVGRTTHEIVCHIVEIPENGADTAHLDYLHGDFVLDFLSAAKHTWDASWIPQPFPNAHIAKIAIDTQVALFGHKLQLTTVKTRITQVGPGIVQLVFPTPFGRILLQETITPIHSNVQRAGHVLWCEPSVPRVVAKAIMKSTLIQFERDFQVWNYKRWIRAPLAVRGDGPILKYRRWVKQFFDRDGGALIRDFDGNETLVERQQLI